MKEVASKQKEKKRMTSFHSLDQLISIKSPIEMIRILQEECPYFEGPLLWDEALQEGDAV